MLPGISLIFCVIWNNIVWWLISEKIFTHVSQYVFWIIVYWIYIYLAYHSQTRMGLVQQMQIGIVGAFNISNEAQHVLPKYPTHLL